MFSESNPDKGQTYYYYIFKPELGINGALFAQKYTVDEWEVLFENNATMFKKEFGNISKKLDNILNSQKFDSEIAPNLKAFVQMYSKDSDKVAGCEEPK
jgi:hypothetical protein